MVVPAYQAESTLSETLGSILAQTFADWEAVIVDDGSTDRTAAIALDFARRDPRFRVRQQPNQGTAAAYNTGVSSALGEYIVMCSADDVLLPVHLLVMSGFIDAETGYDIYACNGYRWQPGHHRELIYDHAGEEVVSSLRLEDVIQVCFYGVGAAYRRSLFPKVGGYRSGVFGEDYDFWLRAMAMGARHRYLPTPLSLFRVSRTQKSARLETVYRSDIRLVTDLRRDFPLSPAENRAVDDCIADREQLIAELHRPREVLKDLLRPLPKRVVIRVLGRDRARRVKRSLRARLIA